MTQSVEASRAEPAAARDAAGLGGAPLPVTYSTLAGEAIAGVIEGAYALGSPVACELLRPGTNDTYVVSTPADCYIARIYGSRWRSASDIAYEMELLTHLARKGVSVALPVAAVDGGVVHDLAAPEGVRRLVIFTCAPGKPLSWDKLEHAEVAGRMAALIHAASDDFTTRHARFRLDLEYLLDKPLLALSPFFSRRGEDWRYLTRLASTLRTMAERAIARGLDWGVCHGDLGNRNIHRADDGTVTALDFDLAGPGWRASDFVAARWLSSYEGREPVWGAFVGGYREVRPLSAADLAAVDVFHGLSRLWTAGLDAMNVSRWGTLPMADHYLDAHLRSLREWEAEHVGS